MEKSKHQLSYKPFNPQSGPACNVLCYKMEDTKGTRPAKQRTTDMHINSETVAVAHVCTRWTPRQRGEVITWPHPKSRTIAI